MTDVLVNLGCGLTAPEGWVNVDRSPNVILSRIPLVKQLMRRAGLLSAAHMSTWPTNILRHDITRGLPFRDGSISGIYSSHALEHLYFSDACGVLEECRRVLRPDGVLRLALPDAFDLSKALLEGTVNGEMFNRGLNAHPMDRPRRSELALRMFGANQHLWQPTPDLVIEMLSHAGFRHVERCAFRSGRLPRLPEVEHREDSLFIEARSLVADG